MSKVKSNAGIENKEIYKILADNSGDFIALHDMEGKFLYASPSVKKILGYSPEELKGMLPFGFVHADDMVSAREVHAATKNNKNIAPFRFRFMHKNGHYVWLETTIRVQKDEEGNPLRIIVISRDISERKQAEEVLKESEEKYRVLFETAKDAIFIIDLDTHIIIDANKSASAMYGYTVEELKGLNVRDISAEKEQTDISLDEAKTHIPERYHLKKDGTVFPIEVNAASFKTSNNNLHVGIVRDITERKNAEEALKTSEFKYRSLLDKVQFGVIVHDADSKILSANPYALNLLGITQENVLGKKSIDQVWNFLRSDGSKMPLEEYPAEMVIKTKKSVRDYIVGVYQSTTKEKKWALVNADPEFDEQGKIKQVIISFIDITQRKKAEWDLEETRKRLKILNDLTIEGIVLHENSVILDCNPSILNMLKAKKEEFIGDTIFSYIHDNDHNRVKQRLKEGNTEAIELRLVRKDGTVFMAEVETNQMEMYGKIFRVVAVRDITKRKEAEDALVRSEKELREANITKDRFFSIIAHDLKSPFNILLGYSELLRDNFNEFDNDERDNLVFTLHEMAQKTFNLVQNLLAWSRTQTNRLEFMPREIEITNLINENVALFIEPAIKKNIKLTYTPKNECQALADAEMISTVMRNLLNNAIKFTKREGLVEIHNMINNEKMIEIIVKDTGVGISPDNLEKIFKIDEDVVTRGTNNEIGTGLGLILCKEFVEKNKGRIWVESQKDVGSSFHFTLPVAAGYDL